LTAKIHHATGEAAKEVFATRLRALAEPAEDLGNTGRQSIVESGISTAFYWDFMAISCDLSWDSMDQRGVG